MKPSAASFGCVADLDTRDAHDRCICRARRRALGHLAGLAGAGFAARMPEAAAQTGRAAPGAGNDAIDGALRRAWPTGRPTPPLDLPGYEAPRWRLSQATGKVVLLNFWASWCGPCRTEMPSLELLADRHERDGLIVMAVNYRETDAAIKRFLDEMPIALTILRDVDGMAARAYGVRMFPSTVVIRRDGRAAFTVVGELNWIGEPARRWLAAVL